VLILRGGRQEKFLREKGIPCKGERRREGRRLNANKREEGSEVLEGRLFRCRLPRRDLRTADRVGKPISVPLGQKPDARKILGEKKITPRGKKVFRSTKCGENRARVGI